MYISEDILDNDDKYFAEGYGKQKAKKGIKFLKCPNILILQLKRFEYNQKKEAMVKINEYFEFYEELNLEKYMYNNSSNEDSHENMYSMHSVVVHKGSPNSGHYYAYIKPQIEDDWIQFNDEIVKPADKYEVFDNNFGGTNKYYKLKPKGDISETNYSFESNAYILVYVKKSVRNSILEPLKIENIPKQIKERFDTDLRNEQRRLNKKNRSSNNIILQIFSPEVIRFFDNVGINNSLFDLSIDNPLFLDYRRVFKIHVPRFFTFNNLINFISDQTKISYHDIVIYEYFPNQKENFIRRSDFSLKLIKPEDYESLIEIYTMNHKQCFPLLFLFNKKNFNFFKSKSKILEENDSKEICFIEDYTVCNTKNNLSGIIHIPSKMNLLQLNDNNNNSKIDESPLDTVDDLNETENKNANIIFLKLFFPNNLLENLDCLMIENGRNILKKSNIISDNYSIRIINVFEFSYDYTEPGTDIFTNLKHQVLKKIDEFMKDIIKIDRYLIEYVTIIKEKLDKNDFSFITERTCLIDYPSDKLYEDISSENIMEIFRKNKGIILIPNLTCNDNLCRLNSLKSENIKKELEIYFNKVFIDLYCLSTNLPLYDKMEFNIKEIKEEITIKQKILEKIKQKKMFNLIFKFQNHFLITANQETLTAKDFIEKVDLSYFEIINNRETNGKTSNMYREVPIAKYVNPTEMRIDLTFNYIPKANLSEYKNFEVCIFDKDSNKIAFLSCVLPRKIKRSKEIVEFIAKSSKINKIFKDYNNDLFKTNSQKIDKIDINKSYFILQHPKDYFIFHFITDENTEIFKFEGKGDFKYRLQIYDDAFISKIPNPIYAKIYLKINILSNLDVKVNPMIIYLEKIQTVFELKLEVFKCLENNRNMNKALNPNYSNMKEFLENEKNLEKIRFFKFSVISGKCKKIANLTTYKEDDYVETVFKGERICNLMVEISLNNLIS